MALNSRDPQSPALVVRRFPRPCALALSLALGLANFVGCATRVSETVPPTAPALSEAAGSAALEDASGARLPASARLSRYRSYFGEKLPVRDENAACKAVPPNLRSMFYEQFLHLAESRGTELGARDAAKFGKLLALAWKESRGDATLLIDAAGAGDAISSARFLKDNLRPAKRNPVAKNTLESRKVILTARVKQDNLTKSGIFQAKETDFDASRKAVAQWKAIRALVKRSPEETADRCGTRWLYEDSEKEITEAFTETGNCKPAESSCFIQWTTLCPNLSLALELYSSDPRLKKTKPICQAAFASLLAK